MDSLLSYAQSKQKEIIGLIRRLVECESPSDSPRDVGRFVEMLRSMLDRTQFILITHNRRTMEIANRLYGVTMEEPGVSKLISVQLH